MQDTWSLQVFLIALEVLLSTNGAIKALCKSSGLDMVSKALLKLFENQTVPIRPCASLLVFVGFHKWF